MCLKQQAIVCPLPFYHNFFIFRIRISIIKREENPLVLSLHRSVIFYFTVLSEPSQDSSLMKRNISVPIYIIHISVQYTTFFTPADSILAICNLAISVPSSPYYLPSTTPLYFPSNIFNLLTISSGSGNIAFISSGNVFLN